MDHLRFVAAQGKRGIADTHGNRVARRIRNGDHTQIFAGDKTELLQSLAQYGLLGILRRRQRADAGTITLAQRAQ